jgi:hypothetical protein
VSPDAAKRVRLRLLYSREVVSPKGALVPMAEREAEWVESKPKAGATYQAEKGKALAAGEEMKVAAVDLRAWFDLDKPGFYRLELSPAVADTAPAARVAVEIRFSLGARPDRKRCQEPFRLLNGLCHFFDR